MAMNLIELSLNSNISKKLPKYKNIEKYVFVGDMKSFAFWWT